MLEVLIYDLKLALKFNQNVAVGSNLEEGYGQ